VAGVVSARIMAVRAISGNDDSDNNPTMTTKPSFPHTPIGGASHGAYLRREEFNPPVGD